MVLHICRKNLQMDRLNGLPKNTLYDANLVLVSPKSSNHWLPAVHFPHSNHNARHRSTLASYLPQHADSPHVPRKNSFGLNFVVEAPPLFPLPGALDN
jgi:hypothetical protein